MKKQIFPIIVILCILFLQNTKAFAMPNPWVDYGNNSACAAAKAGFSFPLQVKDANFRAMEDMIEVTFPLNRGRKVIVRKSHNPQAKTDIHGIADISGDYNIYPTDKYITLNNEVFFRVRGKKNKYYTVNFAAESGYYSFYSSKGLKLKDIKYLYKLLEKTECRKN